MKKEKPVYVFDLEKDKIFWMDSRTRTVQFLEKETSGVFYVNEITRFIESGKKIYNRFICTNAPALDQVGAGYTQLIVEQA